MILASRFRIAITAGLMLRPFFSLAGEVRACEPLLIAFITAGRIVGFPHRLCLLCRRGRRDYRHAASDHRLPGPSHLPPEGDSQEKPAAYSGGNGRGGPGLDGEHLPYVPGLWAGPGDSCLGAPEIGDHPD